MSGSISSLTVDIAGKSLNALWQRANAISDNIANVDTPGYRAKRVSFEDQLQGVLSDNTLTGAELSSLEPVTSEDDAVYSTDSNGVDIESEMINLTRNQLQYNYLQRALADNLGLLNTAASEGKR